MKIMDALKRAFSIFEGKKGDKIMSGKRNLWRGLTTLTASLLTISVAAGPIVDSYRTDIDKFLGTKSSAMVTDSTDEDLYTFKSDYSSTT